MTYFVTSLTMHDMQSSDMRRIEYDFLAPSGINSS